MGSQAEIYDDAAAHYDKEATVIRQKAAKLRKKEQNRLLDRSGNSVQPSTS